MKIYALIVCYRPFFPKLKQLCEGLLTSGAKVVLLDNTEETCSSLQQLPAGCELIKLYQNFGIAHAQNIGIKYAREQSADVIIFFDQDSVIDDKYVAHILAGVDVNRPGVWGPVSIDEERGFEYPCYRFNKFGYPLPVLSFTNKSTYLVDLLISSGSLVTSVTFDIVGLMDEDFFIDYVDYVWCMQCRSLGIPIHVNPNVLMSHSVGIMSLKLGPITTFVHSPIRSYYKVRNVFLLLRKKQVPVIFALKEITSALANHLVQLIFVTNKLAYLTALFSGVLDGLLGITGKKD